MILTKIFYLAISQSRITKNIGKLKWKDFVVGKYFLAKDVLYLAYYSRSGTVVMMQTDRRRSLNANGIFFERRNGSNNSTGPSIPLDRWLYQWTFGFTATNLKIIVHWTFGFIGTILSVIVQ